MVSVGGPTMTGKAGLVPGKRLYVIATTDCFGSGGAAAMALRAACSGTEIQDYTHLNGISTRTARRWLGKVCKMDMSEGMWWSTEGKY